MKIGITCDLREDYLKMGYSQEETAEFDPPETLEGIKSALEKAGYQADFIGNFRALLPRLLKGDKWDLVFNICEGMKGFGREALVPALLDEYGIPYVFSGPLALTLTLHKGAAKSAVRDAGVRTAPFAVVETGEEIHSVNLGYPAFVKPVAEGSGKGIDGKSKVKDAFTLKEKCLSILKNFNQPALVEAYLPGKDFTVSILGTGKNARVIGVTQLVPAKGAKEDFFSFENKEDLKVEYVPASKNDEAACAELALKAWKALGCRDVGRVDVRMDAEGKPNFIEANPLPEINPEYSEITNAFKRAGFTYDEMIKMIVESALERV